MNIIDALRDQDRLQQLINNGIDLNSKDARGDTILHYAIRYANYNGDTLQAIPMLIVNGANINVQNNIGETPLHMAINYGKQLPILILNGADPNIQDIIGNSPLHSATMLNNTYAVKMLLNANADPDIKNNRGLRPIDYARRKGLDEIINLLESAMGRKMSSKPAKTLTIGKKKRRRRRRSGRRVN
jgi:ankyrin repeat protein